MGLELVGRDMFMLFPAGLFTGMVPDITMCDRIEKKLREMQKAGDGVTLLATEIAARETWAPMT